MRHLILNRKLRVRLTAIEADPLLSAAERA
jgi:hypothetical protein